MPGNPVVIPLNPDELTDVKRRQALEALNLTKERINEIIKGTNCTNGINQKRYFTKGESVVSPTVLMEGLFTTFVIDV